jgi:hypothetical protein
VFLLFGAGFRNDPWISKSCGSWGLNVPALDMHNIHTHSHAAMHIQTLRHSGIQTLRQSDTRTLGHSDIEPLKHSNTQTLGIGLEVAWRWPGDGGGGLKMA